MNINVKQPERLVISAAEVAGLLGYRCRESFSKHRTELEAVGFPSKLPGINGWSKPAIVNWLERNGEVDDLGADEPPHRPTPLERRFGA